MALDSEKYLNSFLEVHGKRYDYSNVVFGNSESKITIGCRKHGDFQMTPRTHKNGHGCPHCARVKRSATKIENASKSFISRARQIHGHKYDYSKVEYVKAKQSVTITCKVHGDFHQTPVSHLQGKGCAKCARNRKLTRSEFINRANRRHGLKYSYDSVIYKNTYTKVTITCPVHGEFKMEPDRHMRSDGCPECSKFKPLTTEDFIYRSVKTHGDTYSYSNASYVNSYTLVSVTCPTHGDFKIKPNLHYNGKGCPSCDDSGKECYVYLLLSSEGRCKVGISVDVPRRMVELRSRSPMRLETVGIWKFPTTLIARTCEQYVHSFYKEHNSGLTGFDGCTEYFNLPPYILADLIFMLGGEPV